jgi:formylglycine-generating enzyme required for sulfatase activity
LLAFLTLCSCLRPVEDSLNPPGNENRETAGPLTVLIETEFGVPMLLLPGGVVEIGSDNGSPDERPRHEVQLNPFLIDKFEVTQDALAKLQFPNPSQFKGERRPVDQVRWVEAALFCNARSSAEGLEPCYDEFDFKCNFEANGYRLPTEAEWEYAARAGTQTEYPFGDTPRLLRSYACYAPTSSEKTDVVGRRKPNPFGLHDMLGNVAEWCNDIYDPDYYAVSERENPRGPSEGKKRVLRGGSWSSDEQGCRASTRWSDIPGITDACLANPRYGFRCVRRPNAADLAKLP